MTETIIVDYVGYYDSTTGNYQYFDDASKKKGFCTDLLKLEDDDKIIPSNKGTIVEDYGYMTDIEDTLLDYSADNILSGINNKIAINHVVLSREKFPSKTIDDIESTLFYPSIVSEKEHRAIIQKMKTFYIQQNNIQYKLDKLFQLWEEPKCGIGLTIKTSTGQNIIVNNKVGSRAFNVFNSHFLGMEVHRDLDLLMAMACFLKYNSVWGGGHTVSLKNFDYISVFLGKSSFVDDMNEENEKSNDCKPYTFLAERAMLIANYSISRARALDAAALARAIDSLDDANDDDHNHNDNNNNNTYYNDNDYNNDIDVDNNMISPPSKRMKRTTTRNNNNYTNNNSLKKLRDTIKASKQMSKEFSACCNHKNKIPLDGILPLKYSKEVICLKCFLTMFFFDWELSVFIKDYSGLIKTIREWSKISSPNEIYVNRGLKELVACIRSQLGSVNERGLNWPVKALESGHYEFYTYTLSQLLENDRWNLLSTNKNEEKRKKEMQNIDIMEEEEEDDDNNNNNNNYDKKHHHIHNHHHNNNNNYNNGDMEPGLLYRKMNKFGKMLLLLMANCTVHEYNREFNLYMSRVLDGMKKNVFCQTMETILKELPFTKLNGKWFNISHKGPSVWNYQIYSMKTIGKECPSLSLESRRLIPLSPEDNECCTRILFKFHCRGSDLAKGGEVVSDICNSVSEMQKLLNNKKYRLNNNNNHNHNDNHNHNNSSNIDNNEIIIESVVVVGDPIISLEVTNYRPLKCSSYKNGSLISNRLSMLLNTRSGSRVKILKPPSSSLSIALLENLSDNAISTAACERVLKGSKILYYDIETTSLSPLTEGATITSIGCVLAKGDGTKSRCIFAYRKENETKLKEEILQLYKDEKKHDDTEKKHQLYDQHLPIPEIIVANTQWKLLSSFAKYVKSCGPLTAIAGWNNNTFDDPYLFIHCYFHLKDQLLNDNDNDNNNNNNNNNNSSRNSRSSSSRSSSSSSNNCNDDNDNDSMSNFFKGLFNFSLLTENNTNINTTKAENIEELFFKYTTKKYNPNIRAAAAANMTSSGGGGGGPSLEWLISCLSICPSLDIMKIIGKRFSESLPSMSLNTVLEFVCRISNTNAVQKDPIDVKYHLIEYMERDIKENALVQKYCCKDAYLVSEPAERVGVLPEIVQLGKESNMSVSVVASLYTTQLQIINGAVLRAMGTERAFMRGCTIHPHSQYTKTFGGFVTTPLAKFQTLHTMDMGSLYPSTMRQNNLDTTTVCSHRQIIDARNRVMLALQQQQQQTQNKYNNNYNDNNNNIDINNDDSDNNNNNNNNNVVVLGTQEALDIMDMANAYIFERYRPCDIVADTWKNNRAKRRWPTRYEYENTDTELDWNDDDNSHNCMNEITDLGYFPEVPCNDDLQYAAMANDDSHVELCSLEYLLPFIVPMMIDNPAIILEITAHVAKTIDDVIAMLEKDFTKEKDEIFIAEKLTYVGNTTSFDNKNNKDWRQYRGNNNNNNNNIEKKLDEALNVLYGRNNNKSRIINEEQHIKEACRLISLCARITRRTYAYDSAQDEAVIKWTNRLLNVGSRCRMWNARNWVLKGEIPALQRRYREERLVLKRQVKLKAKTEPLVAAQCKVEEGVKKIFMNSIYGVLVLRVGGGGYNYDSYSKWHKDNSLSRLLIGNVSSGVGGGTRHAPMGNQVTQISRRIFLNITPSIRHFFPDCIQGYGDTDSVFQCHNFAGEMQIILKPEEEQPEWNICYPVIEMDLILRERIARLLQIIVNCTTKGIRFNPQLAAGEDAMIIEHERLSIVTHTASKKTYHMIHFKEEEKLYIDLVKTLIALNEEAINEIEENVILENFCLQNPLSRIISLVKNNRHWPHYIYPHNAAELWKLFRTDIKADTLNKKGGGEIFGVGQSVLPISSNCDEISKVFRASKYIAVFKLEPILNTLGNGFLEIPNEAGQLIDITTGEVLENSEKIEDILLAFKILKVYKKGKFAKKGISHSNKLREIQTACLAWIYQYQQQQEQEEEQLKDQFFSYDKIVQEHAKRCLSYTENPERYLMVSRVNKEQIPLKPNTTISLPNPTARIINNHLNPSKAIDLNEKFLTVLGMSGRSLVYPSMMTNKSLFQLEKKRWNPSTETGIVAVSTLKNLGVVCYTINSITELIKKDCESLMKILVPTLESLDNVARGEGFSLANGSLSYNTGVLVADILVKFLINTCFKSLHLKLSNNNDVVIMNDGEREEYNEEELSNNNISSNSNIDNNNNNSNSNDYDNSTKKYHNDNNNNNNNNKNNNNNTTFTTMMLRPLVSKLDVIFYSLKRGKGRVGVPQINLFNNKGDDDTTTTTTTTNNNILDKFLSLSLKDKIEILSCTFQCHPSVFYDINSLIKIWCRAREYKTPTRKNEETPLSHLINNNARPCIFKVLKACAIHVHKHAITCNIKLDIPTEQSDNNFKIEFLKQLLTLIAHGNCLETCVLAGADALFFNLLYCLFLRREHEKYEKNTLYVTESDKLASVFNGNVDIFISNETIRLLAHDFYRLVRGNEIVKNCFKDRYNPATNSLIFLAEPSEWLSGNNKIMPCLKKNNKITWYNFEKISASIGEGSPILRNSLVGQILEPCNIRSFPKTNVEDDVNDTDSIDYLYKYETNLLTYRPGFFHKVIIEKTVACLGAIIFFMWGRSTET
uniref:DNA-directed DNA polymerase n=1 Tax=Metapenaeus joyneri majanivirus TaxID=2984280 RepID=A0A9C7BIA7_9VIRU|nr:MAG: wsv514-like protein [Metapenaeus joyneri majanivirus]